MGLRTMEAKKIFSYFREGEGREKCELLAFLLLFAGLFVWPINIRFPIFQHNLGLLALLNYLGFAALLILTFCKHEYTKIDLLLVSLWCLMLIPLLISNRNIAISKTIAAICNCWLPMFLILYKIEKENAEKVIGVFLFLYDVFICILLCLAVIEVVSGGVVLKSVVHALSSHGFKCRELNSFISSSSRRFASVWGHPLTNAVLFNAFFILNDIYFRSTGKKYFKLFFFLVAMSGVLLCAGKTAFGVLALYVIVSNWNQKKWFIVFGAASIVLYFMGAFDQIINRFSNGSLTTGRFETMVQYFSNNVYPLRFWSGYGTGTIYHEEISYLKAGFEFPLMMYSLDYGILFALVLVGAAYIYASYYFLKERQVISWIGYSLLYAQINTYNGISLYNQDICCMLCVFTLIAVNCVKLCQKPMEK